MYLDNVATQLGYRLLLKQLKMLAFSLWPQLKNHIDDLASA